MASPLSLIICTFPRSGSYFFSDILNRNGLPFGDEWLTPFHRESRKWQYGQDESHGYIEYLRMLSKRERYEGVFVLKAMYPSFEEMVNNLNDEPSLGTFSSTREKISSVFPNPKFLYLTRGDRIAQAISHLKAKQTGEWVKRSQFNKKSSTEPVYSYTGIASKIADRKRNEILWEKFFESERIEPFRILYEDLKSSEDSVMNDLFSWLGICKKQTPDESKEYRFSKMASSLNDDWHKRFLEDQALCKEADGYVDTSTLDALEIVSTTLKSSYEILSPCRFQVKIENHGNQEPEFRGYKDGSGWLRVLGSLRGGPRDELFQQEIRPNGIGGFVAECAIPSLKVPGNYNLKLVISGQSLGHKGVRERKGFESNIQFILPEERNKCRKLFPGIQDMPNGWQYLDWFGCFLDDKFPWLYHADHEWLYVKPAIEENGAYHILDLNLGWVEIDPENYPKFKSLESEASWIFKHRDKDVRVFELLPESRLVNIPTNASEQLKKLKR